MGDNYSYVEKKGKLDIYRSPLTLIMFFLCFIGVFWLASKNVGSGILYWMVWGFVFCIPFVFLLYIKDDDSDLEMPFSTSLYKEVFWYWTGRIVPVAIYLITMLIGVFNPGVKAWKTSVVFVPLQFGGFMNAQTYEAIKTTANSFWQYFTVSWTAGVAESFFANFTTVIMGILMGRYLRTILGMVGKKLDFGTIGNKWFDFFCGILISMIFFMFLHSNNSSYNSINMYVVAGIFITIMNILVYVFNFLLAFSIGFHQSNNELWMGWAAVVAGLTTGWGWLLLIFQVTLLVFLFNGFRRGEVKKVLKAHRIGL